jgi:adenylate cyclase
MAIGQDRSGRVVPRHPARAHGDRPAPTLRLYVGITGLLVLLVVVLVGGIIWFNAQKSSELMVAASERLTRETSDKIIERLRLLYDPIYAIVGLGAEVSDLTVPLSTEAAATGDYPGLPLMLRALRTYPQIWSLYVGFANGEFYMVAHLAGGAGDKLRAVLHAPAAAEFANEIVFVNANGGHTVRWLFRARDGSPIAPQSSAPAPAPFDPRVRPWYEAALKSDEVQQSQLYLFAASGVSGFTLSRRFGNPARGVVGADIAAGDIAQFLADQQVTPSSRAMIFTKTGQVVVVPDAARMAAMAKSSGPNPMIALPSISQFGDPLLTHLFAQFKQPGTRLYDVDGQTYVGRVVEVPPRYGKDELLALMVPLDEIERPITEARNEALWRSILIVVLVLPLYATLVIAWIDRRLGVGPAWLREAEADED